MPKAPLWKKGEKIEITLEGRTVEGEILLASSNGQSLMLGFEALFGGFAGMMPVLWEQGAYRELVMGRAVEVRRLM